MDVRHKKIRSWLRKLPVTDAKEFLMLTLPPRECAAIFLSDIEGRDLFSVSETLNCSDSNIKKMRQRAYERLVPIYFQ